MAVDVRSLARAAAEAALGDEAPKKKGLSPWQALAIGAGLVTAGRMATGPGGRFVRELVEGHSSNGSAEDEEPEAEADDEPEAEADDEPQAEADDEPQAEADNEPQADADDEPQAEADNEPQADADNEPQADADNEPQAEADNEPQAEADNEPQAEADNEPDGEQDEWAEGEAEGGRPGRPRHPLFEHALAPKAAQRRDSESPKRREPKGRRTAPPRRPRRPRTPAQRA
jgi:hypothetical protein